MRRVVLVSSTAVYGIPKVHPIPRTIPLVGVGWYGESKIEAEEVTRDSAGAGSTSSIVRPKTFIGPERLGVFEILFDWIRDGRRIYMLGDGRTATSCSRWRTSSRRSCSPPSGPRPPGETVNVGAKEFGTVRSDLQALIDHAGSASRLRPFPRGRPRSRSVRSSCCTSRRSPSGTTGRPIATRSWTIAKARAAARLVAAILERGDALPDVRLVPGPPRLARRRRRHAPRAVEPAGARAAEADQLSARSAVRRRQRAVRPRAPSPRTEAPPRSDSTSATREPTPRAACAPSPPGPKTTAGMPASAISAASVQ